MARQREFVFDRYVFDADSLINLEKSGALRHLRPPTSAIVVPQCVAREVRQPGSALQRWLSSYPRVVSQFATTEERTLYAALVGDPALGQGEAAAIAMARERGAMLVMDDTYAQRIAREYGVSLIGTEEFLQQWPHKRR